MDCICPFPRDKCPDCPTECDACEAAVLALHDAPEPVTPPGKLIKATPIKRRRRTGGEG